MKKSLSVPLRSAQCQLRHRCERAEMLEAWFPLSPRGWPCSENQPLGTGCFDRAKSECEEVSKPLLQVPECKPDILESGNRLGGREKPDCPEAAPTAFLLPPPGVFGNACTGGRDARRRAHGSRVRTNAPETVTVPLRHTRPDDDLGSQQDARESRF